MAEKKTKKRASFEENMEQLEDLMKNMRNAPLNELMDGYAKATALLKECKEMLEVYNAEFKQLSEDCLLTDIDEEK